MFYGVVLFLLGAAALALALFGRDLTQLLRHPLRDIVESVGARPTPTSTPFAPDPAAPAEPGPAASPDPDPPAPLPPRYDLSPGMRVFFAGIGIPVLALGLLRMTFDVLPESGDSAGGPARSTSTGVPTTAEPARCPPVAAGFFRVGDYYKRPGDPGPGFQVVDPAIGGDPDAPWIDGYGLPVLNPRIPLGPEAVAVTEAFGSAAAAVDFNRCSVERVAGR
ncbi:MAG TPA: hypothetical protein VFI47_05955 [Acidimicrobiales bacterium]|nr:hypothetical protein [Acidimicrobiales bacterium]